MYATLVSRQDALFDRNILIGIAENPKGQPAFRTLKDDPPAGEDEFANLWKLYFLALIGDAIDSYDIQNDAAKKLTRTLSDARLRGGPKSLRQHLRDALDYVRRLAHLEEVEPNMAIDPTTGMPSGFSTRIKFAEPSSTERAVGALSVDDLFALADEAFAEADVSLWILLDRLDVAFAGTPQFETLALRALFRVYLDLNPYETFRLKIFLRSDIWNSLSRSGFREASHVTRELKIRWDRSTLLQLITSRITKSDKVTQRYDIDRTLVLTNSSAQENLLTRLYPTQVDSGPNKPATFDWCLSRTQDGTQQTAPRELIHLFSTIREMQLKRLEAGDPLPGEETLFDRTAIKAALPEVSQVRLEKTLYAEYPEERGFIEAMEGAKTNHSISSLSSLWAVPQDEALGSASRLVEIGFFEKRGTYPGPVSYWVPFLYRPALKMVQGSAEGVLTDAGNDESQDIP